MSTNPESVERKPFERTDALQLLRKVAPKRDWPAVAERVIARLRDEHDDVTAYVLLKQMNEILAVAIKDQLPRAFKAHQGKQMDIMGAIVVTRNLAPVWGYDDVKLMAMETRATELALQIKARKEFLQSLKDRKGEQILEGGELVKPAKCLEAGATLAVTFPS